MLLLSLGFLSYNPRNGIAYHPYYKQMKEYDYHIDESQGKMERYHYADEDQYTNKHTLPPFARNKSRNTMKSANSECYPQKSRNNSEVY